MRIIDRYIIKTFISTFFFSIMALYVIFLIVNLLESLDDFMDSNMPTELILKYYLYFFPEILKILTPVAMLLSTLFSIGKLANSNEITAMKTGGISIFRIMLPVLVFSFLISAGHLYFNGWVVPSANEQKIILEKIYLKKKHDSGPIYNFYFRNKPNEIFYMNYYIQSNKSASKVAFEYYNGDLNPRISKRIEAVSMKWDSLSNKWIFNNVVVREYTPILKIYRLDSLYSDLNISPDEILKFTKTLDEMTFPEIDNYISLMKQGGRDTKKQEIEYHSQLSYPFANIIVILFGVPFASIKKRGGMAINIAAALVVSFLYLIFTKVSQSFTIAMDINPIIAAWFANIIFLIVGIINLFRIKS